jgi:hypothetical protein
VECKAKEDGEVVVQGKDGKDKEKGSTVRTRRGTAEVRITIIAHTTKKTQDTALARRIQPNLSEPSGIQNGESL